MPANTEIPDLIMQLMRGLNKRGVRTVESPELSAYMNERMLGQMPQGPAPISRPNIYDISGDMAPTTGRPPPISRDPWFDEYLPETTPTMSDPNLSIDEVRNLGRPPTPGGFAGPDVNQTYLWVIKNGKKTRMDGPFTDDISAAKALREWQKLAAESGAQLEFEIGPQFDPR